MRTENDKPYVIIDLTWYGTPSRFGLSKEEKKEMHLYRDRQKSGYYNTEAGWPPGEYERMRYLEDINQGYKRLSVWQKIKNYFL